MHVLIAAASTLLIGLAASDPFVINKDTSISYQGTSADGVEQFQGILFGHDTSGPNRFTAPKVFYPPAGTTVDATKAGAACPQPSKGIVPCMSDVKHQSEDCLSLRIARLAEEGGKDGKPLPVMVYIYGGGSIVGEAYDDFFQPQGLVKQAAENDQPVIYVAMNYRIGIFGFPASDAFKAAKAENLGLKDQYLALQWVKDNIAAFGGDPENVTIFGQSFGGISVGLQMVSYGADRDALFHKAIMTSGGIAGDRSGTITLENTLAVGKTSKCVAADGQVDDAAIECMKKIPTEEFNTIQVNQATGNGSGFGFAAFSAVVDGDILPEQTGDLIKAGKFYQHVPLISTWTMDDGSFSADTKSTTDEDVINSFKSYFPNYSDDIGKKLLSLYPESEFETQAATSKPATSPQFFRASRIVRDIDPVCPLLAFSRKVQQFGESEVYLAVLNATRLTPYWDAWGMPLGISHLSDIPYFFNEPLPSPGDNSAEAFALAAPYSGSFASFANTGDPVSKGKTTFQEWPAAFSEGSKDLNILVIGGQEGTELANAGDVEGQHRFLKTELRKRKMVSPLASSEEEEKLIERCAYISSIRP